MNGNNSVVRSDGYGIGRMLQIDTLSIHISDLSIENFSSSDSEGGALRLAYASNSTFRNILLRNNCAHWGGSVFLSYTDNVIFGD